MSPDAATVKMSLTDVEPVMDVLLAGVRLYEAIYHMPGAAEFFMTTASREVGKAYADMGKFVNGHAARLRLTDNVRSA